MKPNPCEQVFEPLLNSRAVAQLLGVYPATLQRISAVA
jgi:hypothetical protein